MALQNLPPEQIIAMLNTKGIRLGAFCQKNNFHINDVHDVINGKELYPNIANMIAQAVNAEPYMLWPTLYPVPQAPVYSGFVLRVTFK